MRIVGRPWRLLVLFGFLLLICYAFLAGPLFAWSPVKPGYEVLHLERADVYFSKGTSLDPVFRELDRFIARTEEFHQLKLPHRMTIIVCGSWSDFHRFLPTVRGTGVGAATPEFGTVMYITPKVSEMRYDPGEFVRHELSHAVLEQNATLWNSIHFKQAPWLLEGLGVLSADQKAYGTWNDFLNRARSQDIGPMFSATPGRAPAFDLRFGYLAWRYFLQWLIETRGRPEFQRFVTIFLERPTETQSGFRDVYSEELTAAVARFQSSIQDGTWRAE